MGRSRNIKLGNIQIGGGAPVSVQSMTNTDTRDHAATLNQIRDLHRAGCDITRVAVPDMEAARALEHITPASPIPVVADIHFDYRLALASIANGADGIRINPGNLGEEEVRQVSEAAANNGVVVRVGVNSGSISGVKGIEPGLSLAERLVQAALRYCDTLEAGGCRTLKVSLKASDVPTTVKACRTFASRSDYPLHIGITEAGTGRSAIIKSAAGIGCLLLEGIGDTIRVSLTADPVEEVKVGIAILEAIGLRDPRPDIVSCPTCARTRIDLIALVNAVTKHIRQIKSEDKRIDIRKIAIMGCAVNGPGEARDADLGIAGGKKSGVLFKKGKIIKKLPEEELLDALLEEIRQHTRRSPSE